MTVSTTTQGAQHFVSHQRGEAASAHAAPDAAQTDISHLDEALAHGRRERRKASGE